MLARYDLGRGPAPLTAKAPLPADPGAAGMAAVARIDANGNAGRDDLEPFLLQHFGTRPQVLRAMSNLVIGLQATMDATTAQQSARAHTMMIRATECLMAVQSQLPKDAARDANMVTLLVNTPARTAAIAAHKARIGEQSFPMRELEEWEASCYVRADLVDSLAQILPLRH